MAITVYFANFAKRRNSTLQGTFGTSYTCVLKDACSIDRPVFLVSAASMNFNAAKWDDRYYYIDDIVSVRNGQWEVYCSIDLLATYKNYIVGSYQYVERADGGGNLLIPDALNPPTQEIEVKKTLIKDLAGTGGIISWSGGSLVSHYIIAVANGNGITYYSDTDLSAFYTKLFSGSVIGDLENQFYDYRDAIVSIIEVPYSPAGDPNQYVDIGSKHFTDLQMNELSGGVIHACTSVTLSSLAFPSDDHETEATYLDAAPYTTGLLYLPYIGVVSLDMSIFAGTRKIGVDLYIENKTGALTYKISTDGGECVATYQGSCARNVPIASSYRDSMGMIGGVIQTISGAAAVVAGAGNPAAAVLGGGSIAGGLQQIAASRQTQTQTNGFLSSMVATWLGTEIFAEVYTNVPVDWDIDNFEETNGRLVLKKMQLSTYTGFVKCQNAHVGAPAQLQELEQIDELLDSGIFIE